MSYTAPSTQPLGTLITSSMYNNHIIGNIKFLHGPPTVKLQRPASQTITASQWTAIAFSSKVWDSNSMFATTGTKITCKTAGKYQFNFAGGFHSSTQGTVRAMGLRFNATGTSPPTDGGAVLPKTPAGFNWVNSCSAIIAMTTGQFVEACIFSDGSSNGLKSSSAGDKQKVTAIWVSS